MHEERTLLGVSKYLKVFAMYIIYQKC